MALSILSNFAANVAQRNLVDSSNQASSSVAKLSSGLRVLGAKDDAAALAIGSRLRAEVSAQMQASVNAGQAVSMLQIADGALSKTNDILVRMKALAVQAGSDQLGNTERGLIDSEFQQLILEVERISQDTEFNGQALIRGVLGGTAASGVENGTTLGTAIEKADGIESIVFDGGTQTGTFSIANDGTNLIATDIATGTAYTQAIPTILSGQTQAVRFDSINLTVTLNDKFETAATGLLVSGKFSSVTSNLTSANGITNVKVRSNQTAATFSIFTDGNGGITVKNLDNGTSQTKTGIVAAASGTTTTLDFDTLGVTLDVNDVFDPTLNTSLVDVEAISAATAGLITTANGINSLEVDSGSTNDAFQLTYASSTQTFTVTNLDTGKTGTAQLNALPTSGNTSRLEFDVNGDTVTLTIGSTFDTTTDITTQAITSTATGSTAGAVTAGTISITGTSGDVTQLAGLTGTAAEIAFSGTGAAAVLSIGAFTSSAIDLTSTGVKKVTLANNTTGATIDVQFTVGTAFGAGGGAVSGSFDLDAYYNNLFVTGGNTNNEGVITNLTAANTGQIDDAVITRVVGNTDGLTNATLTIDLTTADSANATISLGTGADRFEVTGVDLDTLGTGVKTFTLVQASNAANTVEVQFDITTAFTADTGTDVTVNFSEFLEDVVSGDKSVFDPNALSNATITSGTGALQQVRVASTKGDISDINTSTIQLENLADQTRVDFRLKTKDGDDFVATAVDLSSTGVQTVTLKDKVGNSISIAFDVTTAFNGSETAGTIDLATYLKNVTSATGALSTVADANFTFKIGTGNLSQDRITLTLNAATSEALKIKGLDVKTSATADTASTAVSTAIDLLQTARANVGAFQNRLETAAANLAVTRENTEAARSAILDLDVASEIIKFTSNQILVQSGVSMLAQANQLPQNLLRLLQ